MPRPVRFFMVRKYLVMVTGRKIVFRVMTTVWDMIALQLELELIIVLRSTSALLYDILLRLKNKTRRRTLLGGLLSKACI